MKASEQYFAVVLFIVLLTRWVLTFASPYFIKEYFAVVLSIFQCFEKLK